MRKNGIFWVFGLVLFLGLFFQYNRMGGILQLFPVVNRTAGSLAKVETPWPGAAQAAQDTYLIVYDPTTVESLFWRHETERLLTAKKMKSIAQRDDAPLTTDLTRIRGVILTSGRLGRVASLPAILSYVENGGTAVILSRLLSDAEKTISQETLTKLGVSWLAPENAGRVVRGLTLETDFLPGSRGLHVEADHRSESLADDLRLTDRAIVHVSDGYGQVPLIWQTPLGRGNVYVHNASAQSSKTNRGLLASFLARCGEDGIYPVAGVKLVFIDDFPSPEPDGYQPTLEQEFGITTREFYKRVWWPFMKKMGQKYHLKYTGALIETYGDQVTGPFQPLPDPSGRSSFMVFGNELIAQGGEMGIHGYNHQSLALPGYQKDIPEYVPWPSEENMQEALREVRRYALEIFPKYHFAVYVPPSNILSPQGKDAIRKAIPEIRIFASLYDGDAESAAYYQEFQRHGDGTYDIPRITAGYQPSNKDLYVEACAIASEGVFSHFVHPDEIFYEESRDYTWSQMQNGLEAFLQQIGRRYPWLTPETASGSLPYFDSYFDLEYRVVRKPEELELHCWKYTNGASFLLHSTKKVAGTRGCTVQKAGDETYFVRVTEPEAHIYWERI